MYKILIPQFKGRNKTLARGFWHSQDTKRTCYDYLKQEELHSCNKDKLYGYCLRYNQEAIFYTKGDIGYCYNKKTCTILKLKNRIYKEVYSNFLRREIKEALKLYGGVTIYKIENKYFKEIFY